MLAEELSKTELVSSKFCMRMVQGAANGSTGVITEVSGILNVFVIAVAAKKLAIPAIAFFIKLITMANIRGTDGSFLGGWLGADGENYLSGVDGLLAQGYLSDKSILSYWPAGYPILIWLLTFVSLKYVIALISFSQSIFYAYASYYFGIDRLRALS